MISSRFNFMYDFQFSSQIVARNLIHSIFLRIFNCGIQLIKFPDKVAYRLNKVPMKPAKVNDIKQLIP